MTQLCAGQMRKHISFWEQLAFSSQACLGGGPLSDNEYIAFASLRVSSGGHLQEAIKNLSAKGSNMFAFADEERYTMERTMWELSDSVWSPGIGAGTFSLNNKLQGTGRLGTGRSSVNDDFSSCTFSLWMSE